MNSNEKTRSCSRYTPEIIQPRRKRHHGQEDEKSRSRKRSRRHGSQRSSSIDSLRGVRRRRRSLTSHRRSRDRSYGSEHRQSSSADSRRSSRRRRKLSTSHNRRRDSNHEHGQGRRDSANLRRGSRDRRSSVGHSKRRNISCEVEQRRSSSGEPRRDPRGRRGSSASDRPCTDNVSGGKVPPMDHVSQLHLLKEILNSFTLNRPEGNKFPMLGNVIPEFDPMVKGQTIHMWLNKVEECARLYKWGDDQIIHYALPKLTGIARTWYQALPTMSFTWPEWRVKLTDSFPSSQDYAELLTEMLAKRVKYNESLELYYYEKINLLNRCEIYGKRAVDCLLYGIEDRSLRLGAKAIKCEEPEEVLRYFQSAKQQSRDIERSARFSQDKRTSMPNQQTAKSLGGNESKPTKSVTGAPITCFNCKETGHYSTKCTKKILKCSICNWIGHLSNECTRLPNDANKTTSKENNVMQVDIEGSSNSKYIVPLHINGSQSKGYVDLGSQCTLIQRSEASRLGITWSGGELPVMRGLGNNVVIPIGVAIVGVSIHGVTEEVDAYIVEDSVIKYPVLIGHTFTERPGIIITKTTDSLIIKKENATRLRLLLQEDVEIPPMQMVKILVYSDDNYNGPVYVNGSMRGEPTKEFYLLPGEYEIKNNIGALLLQNFSDKSVTLYKDVLITRVTCTDDSLSVNLLDLNDPDTRSSLNYGNHLMDDEIHRLESLLKEYESCFSSSLKDLGYTNVVEMEIELNDTQPVVYRPYRLSYPERELVQTMVQEMVDADIACESNSPYASPIILVKKKTGEKRLCVDYRALNNKTRKEHYPLPLIDDQLDRLAGNSVFISLDLASGYYQIPIAESSQEFTSFVTPDGQFQFKRMPFGLANAPSVFQRTMNKVFAKLKYIVIYMDDILIPARSFDEGLSRLREVLQLLTKAGLTLKLKKCHFFQKELDFLGFHVSEQGIRPGSRKTVAIANFPVPRNVHEVRRFIGLASFFRRFVKDFALLACPLTNLLKAKFEWNWTEECAQAFNMIKGKLVERPILALFDARRETELHTDASKVGVAGILMQRGDDNLLRPVAYFSRKTSEGEQKLHSFELETIAVIASLDRFRVYLLGLKFKILTDCNALRTTLTKRDLIPRIARWWVQLQEYDCSIEYRPGTRMAHVDALSRAPVTESSAEANTNTHVIDVLQVEESDWILTVQSNDEEIKQIKDILLDDDTKFVADVRNNYQVKGEHVYRIVENGIRWVVPKGVRWQILRMNHDDVGHFGFEKTYSRLKASFWFPRMRRFVKKYVASCLQCAHCKAPSGLREGMLHPIPKVGKPFHTLHTDHLGPFVRTKKGNMYILVIVDAFTKFVNIYAVKDTRTVTAIKIFKEYFSIFGTPSRLISDRGSCFTSTKFKEFTEMMAIKHILNAVATPRANGQVERYNRTILDALSTKCHGRDENVWDEYVGDIQLGINTTVNKSTGKSPSELLFGCKLITTSENMLADIISETSHPVSEEDLMQLRSDAKEKIDRDQQLAKARFDKHRKQPKTYNVGDLVRVERTVTDKEHLGKSKKLLPKFQGPYRVIKVLPNDRYVVEDTPLTKKGNRRYENVVAVDKIHPWLNFNDYSSDNGDENDTEPVCSDHEIEHQNGDV